MIQNTWEASVSFSSPMVDNLVTSPKNPTSLENAERSTKDRNVAVGVGFRAPPDMPGKGGQGAK